MSRWQRRAAFLLLGVAVLVGPALAQSPVAGALLPDGPLSLPAATEVLVRRNLAVEAARLKVTSAAAERIGARLLPRATMTVSAENLNFGGPTPSNQLNEFGLIVTQPFELGNRRALRADLAERGVAVAEGELGATLRRRLSEMRRAWYQVLLDTALLEVARNNREAWDRLVQVDTVRFKEGYIPEAELFKVRLEQSRFDNALQGALLARRQGSIRLLELLGETRFERAATLELDGSLQMQSVTLDLEGLRRAAQERNPEVEVAVAEVARARADARLQRSMAAGEVHPYFGYRRVGLDNTLQVGVTLPLPVGNRNQSAVARADADVKVAETNLALSRTRAVADLEAALAAWETARRQAETYEDGLLRQAASLRDIAVKAYSEGVWDLMALLEAQRSWSDMRAAQARALFEYHVSLFQIELASGVDILK